MGGIVLAILILAVAIGGAVLLWRVSRRAVLSERWALIVVGAGILGFITLGVMAEVTGVLQAMHPLGRPGRGIMDIIGDPVRARSTVDAWQTWFSQPYTSASAARPPLAPRTVSLWYLGLDSFVFVPAYVLFFGVLFRRAQFVLTEAARERKGRPKRDEVRKNKRVDLSAATLMRFEITASLAVGLLALVPFLDLLENGMLWRFIERRIQVCGSGACEGVNTPSDAYVTTLRAVSYTKLALVVAAIVVSLPAAAACARLATDWFLGLRPAMRRLRAQIVLLIVFFVLLRINPQTKDVFRGWGPAHAIPAVIAAFLAGVVTLSIGRRVTYVRRGKDLAGNPVAPRDPERAHAWVVGIGISLIVLGALGIWFELAPRGLVIPGAFLLLLGSFDPAGDNVFVAAPQEVRGGIRDQVPAVLAAAWPILLTYFVVRSLFPLTMYDHAGTFLYTAGVYALWAVVVPSASIALLYYGSLALIERDNARKRPPAEGAPVPATESTPTQVAKVKQVVSTAVVRAAPTETVGWPFLVDSLIVLGFLLWLRILIHPWAVGQALGAITLVVAFFAVLSAAVGRVSLSVERTDPPGLFKVLRMQRTPVFLLLLLWLVLTSVIPRIGREDFHDVRTIRAGLDPSSASMSTNDVFARWVGNQPALASTGSPDAPRQVVPLILVATEGGGIKAATWTALVLDCLLSVDPIVERCPSHASSRPSSVFAESGVSGGSVGLVEYTRFAAEPSLATQPGDWIDRRLGADFVSPSIAWQLFVETPRAWLQFDPGMDRAEVLERGWEQTWTEDERFDIWDALALITGSPPSGGPLAEGFRALWEENPDVPLLLLNGFSVQDGCKFVTTPIDGNGSESNSLNCVAPHDQVAPVEPSEERPGSLSGSRVLTDLLCAPDNDVRLSTAALLSARFPYVSPSGRLLSCPGPDPQRAINVVDGGYGENTGAGSVLELWQSMRPLIDEYNGDPQHGACIVPAMLQIQSGYGPSADVPSTGQGELSVPPKGILHAPNGFTVWQRNAAQLAVLDPLPFTGSATEDARRGVYALVYPYAHPGAEAPLGWTLSDEARSDLRSQLSAEGNVQALASLEEFLNDPGTCAPVDEATA
jgi:hypothetical protein